MKKFLLALPYCSQEVYESVFEDVSKRTNQQFRKYMDLFTQGLVANNIDVHVVSSFAINNDNCAKMILKYNDDIENNIHFHYLTTINLRYIERVLKFFQIAKYVYTTAKKDRTISVICDPNGTSACAGALIGAKLAKVKVIYLYTDLPSIHTSRINKKRNLHQRLADKLSNYAAGYILTTEAMAEALKIKEKPYIVMEGMVDIAFEQYKDDLKQKYKKRVLMYTGGVVKHYGLVTLVDAFIKANIPNTELRIYGSGPYKDELKQICRKTDSIKYLGVVPNNQVVQEQRKATLLVNPRFSNNEYTKYSFPIKNMEYLVSGVAMVSTLLPGMPREYLDYMFLFDDEDVPGMANRLCEILSKTDGELYEFGQKAKQWVLREKNNCLQMKRIKDFINSIE